MCFLTSFMPQTSPLDFPFLFHSGTLVEGRLGSIDSPLLSGHNENQKRPPSQAHLTRCPPRGEHIITSFLIYENKCYQKIHFVCDVKNISHKFLPSQTATLIKINCQILFSYKRMGWGGEQVFFLHQ